MNKIIILFIFLLFIACSQSRDKMIDYKMLIGKWVLNSKTQINYPLIEFKSDSTAIFSSRGDTLYSYNFTLKGDTLILLNSFDFKSINKIYLLNREELIFDKLLEHKAKQEYRKLSQ